jgi:uncharacterized protein YyaL (SSP411 family)
MPNALVHEKSPYLLQHAENPVDWMPWGDAAFEKAQRENKPVFLSIGYSTCHWCHVMERESFENEQIAALLNENFVSIKVDREERPDVDRIYMLFVQATSGGGGWPMSVWLTPERKPFFGGTYFPPDARYGRASFPDVLTHIARAWRERRDELVSAGNRVTEQLTSYVSSSGEDRGEVTWDLFHSGLSPLRRSFDAQFGGFGSAPKFPRPTVFNYLLREHAVSGDAAALEMTVQTLKAMAAGGMNDHLGGGFHRYSVDRQWFVPHFEKMLYDQAQLAWAYLEAFQITGDAELERSAREIFRYVLRDMRHPEGGFYSAEDADSIDPDKPGHKAEGAFYVWRRSEIEQVLGERAGEFCLRYGLTAEGNVAEDPHGEFTGKNILFDTKPGERREDFETERKLLFDVRDRRPRPHLDDKVLTSWNGLMISALAKGAQVLGDAEYLEAAQRATTFLLRTMYSADNGKLLRRFRDGEAAVDGFLDDYAFFAQALLDLYEADFNPEHLRVALQLATGGFAAFEDTEHGGFFSTAEHGEGLLLRMKDDYDGAEPSGNSVATDVLLRLAQITGDESLRNRAARAIESFAPKVKEQPVQAPQMLVALGRLLTEPAQIVIRCERIDDRVLALIREKMKAFRPATTYAVVPDQAQDTLRSVSPFLAGLERKSQATLYECANFICSLPQDI